METFQVQVSLWCKPQARLFVENLRGKFSRAGLTMPELALEDHRDPTNGAIADTDEIDLLSNDDLGPSVHFFFGVKNQAEAELAKQAAEAAAMRSILMPLDGSLIDYPPRNLMPFIDIS